MKKMENSFAVTGLIFIALTIPVWKYLYTVARLTPNRTPTSFGVRNAFSRKDFIFSSSRKASALSFSFFFFSDSLFRKATRSQRLEQYLLVILLATNSFPQTPHTLIILIFTCSFWLMRSSILSQTVSHILSISHEVPNMRNGRRIETVSFCLRRYQNIDFFLSIFSQN